MEPTKRPERWIRWRGSSAGEKAVGEERGFARRNTKIYVLKRWMNYDFGRVERSFSQAF